MLKINRQTDYAVRIVLALAKRGENVRLSTTEIQREMLIPPALMTRIVAQLSREGLINTFPGRDGGLMLPRPASQITLKDVVEAFEGPILLSECMQAKGEDD
jgi:Rrf2 family protein